MAFKLSPSTFSHLGDKLYERRKLGALEIEQLVKELSKQNETQKITDIINQIQHEFIRSTSLNARKGGLIAMAAITLGLGDVVTDFFVQLLPPVLGCIQDADPKVRFYACESLYNIIKVSKERILPYFNEVFDKLCQLAADPDKAVRDAADLLDKMLKEIVRLYQNQFDFEKFIPLFSERVNYLNAPDCRRMILSWVKLLSSVTAFDLLKALHFFLDGLFQMLSDRNEDIRVLSKQILTTFLEEIKSLAQGDSTDEAKKKRANDDKLAGNADASVAVLEVPIEEQLRKDVEQQSPRADESSMQARGESKSDANGRVGSLSLDDSVTDAASEASVSATQQRGKIDSGLDSSYGPLSSTDGQVPTAAANNASNNSNNDANSNTTNNSENRFSARSDDGTLFVARGDDGLVSSASSTTTAPTPSTTNPLQSSEGGAKRDTAEQGEGGSNKQAGRAFPTDKFGFGVLVPDSSEFKRIQKGSLMVSSSAMVLNSPNPSPVLSQNASHQVSPSANPGAVPKRTIRYGSILKIILPYCKARDDGTALMAMTWLHEFLLFGGTKILPLVPNALSVILTSASHKQQIIASKALECNTCLRTTVSTTKEDYPAKELLLVLIKQLRNPNVRTRLCSVKWVNSLQSHTISNSALVTQLESLFPVLLSMLSDNEEDVVRLVLLVLSRFSTNDTYFENLVSSLIDLFLTDRKLLEGRTGMIIRHLCTHIPPEKLLRTISQHLAKKEENPAFISTFVQIINLLLLTSDELFHVRESLKALDTPEARELFSVLYRSWCYNEAAVFSLCLLSQMYEHASKLVYEFAKFEITVQFLVEVDRIVQLIESPIFIFLRLQLLEPQRYPYLFKCLYGLLMLLPQTDAFATLRNRLHTISSLGVLALMPKSQDEQRPPPDLSSQQLLEEFIAIQKRNYWKAVSLKKEQDEQIFQTY